MPPQFFNQDNELAQFFTDVEHLRDLFKESVAAPTLTKRLLVIHGVGGVGKSSLLRMFRLHCKSVNVPVALASGDEAKSAVDVLRDWADDLKADGVALPTFAKTFEHYRAIQAKVENEAGKIAGQAVKGAAKTIIETAASTIPGVGPLIGKLGGMGAEALVDWLRGFLTKPDIDLLLDPTKKLTDDFLTDAAPAADKRRIVLMLDTFEQMTALDDWVRDVAQRLPVNALFVIAGRALPNWSRAWQSWMANAQVEELKPMTEDDMRELVRRYYATMRGGEPNPAQVEAIIRFARGLPMVVTSAVQLWIEYGKEDFQSVKPRVVADLVDRLMEGVPNALIPALEAAAIVRWFDQPILRAVTGLADVRDVYNELRRFPFVRTRVEGLALHDAVREIMDENLRSQDSERHCELHERAAAYFEKRLEKPTGEEAERLGLERLYHRVRADEEAGIKLFQEMAGELVNYRLLNRLRVLMNDADNYPLELEDNRLWRDYYNARLGDLVGSYDEAALVYQRISTNNQAEKRLRSYALGELGLYFARVEYLRSKGSDKAIAALKEAIQQAETPDLNTVRYYWELLAINKRLCRWDEVETQYEDFSTMVNRLDPKWTIPFKGTMKDVPGTLGNWREFFDLFSQLSTEVESLLTYGQVRPLLHWVFTLLWMGRYAEVELVCQRALDVYRQVGDAPNMVYRNLGFAFGMQQRFELAEEYFLKSIETQNVFPKLGEVRRMSIIHSFWAPVNILEGRLKEARRKLVCSLRTKRRFKDHIGIPELLVYLGTLSELEDKKWRAAHYYLRALDMRWTGRRYFECGALTGLVRVKHAQSDYAAIPTLLAEAEQLAQQYEYNDHLASLRLAQGHIAWHGKAPSWDNGFDAAQHYYQHALIYALRYNRFLLDEVLSGRPQGTPLRPIIPYCLERGQDGQRMLIALHDWWKTGINDIGTPRPDTISPIPEGIPLLEAERLAREREPGDGSPQKSVVEQIEAVL